MKLIKLNASKRALWYLFKTNKKIFIPEILLVIGAEIPIALMTLFPARIASAAFAGDVKGLGLNALIFFSLGAIHGILWYIADIWYVKKTYPLFYDVTIDAFKYIISKDYPRFIASSPSKMAQYINEMRSNADRIWDEIHYGYIGFVIQAPAVIIIALNVSWIQAVIYVAMITSMVLVLGRKSSKLNDLMMKANNVDNDLDAAIIDSITNFVNVKSFNAEKKEIESLKRLTKISKRQFNKTYVYYTNYWFDSSKIIRFAAWPLVLLSTYWLFKTGQIDASGVVLSVTILVTVTNFIWNLVDRMANAKKNFAKLQNGYNYLAAKENIFLKASDIKLNKPAKPVFKDTLELSNLSFVYPDAPDEKVLKNVNLIIKKNEKIGVVGKSGGGKSTLVKLLLGFYDYPEGTILIDGKPVNKEGLSSINSYVPQDTSLFQQTIKYNVAYAVDAFVSDAEIITAAKKAHAHKFIEKLKDGYDTLVGERGIKLSLGQRQRIAIARAFLKNSDLLILDEATSALDSKTEAEIQKALEDLWKDKTVIAIAHRLSTLNNVDRIVVIDNGQMAEVGTKEELLKLGGKFAELWKHQKDGLI